MKRTIQTTNEQELEFETPCFVKFTDNILYKIINENWILMVKTFPFSTCVEIVNADQCNPFGNKGWEFTNEDEFMKAYEHASSRIELLFVKECDATNV